MKFLKSEVNIFLKKCRPIFPALGIFFNFFFLCCSPPLTQVLLTFHEHLFGAICALHCGASVSVNSALQHHLVCTLTFWSVLNFGTLSAATYGGGGVPLVCEVRPTSNTSDYKSGLQRPDLTTMALDFVGGEIKKISKSKHFIFGTKQKMTLDLSKEIFTCMELFRPLRGWASVKNSVLWLSRP